MGTQPEARNQEPERPKIYVTDKGARYVDANELMRSKRGRAAVKAAAKIPVAKANRKARRDNSSQT